MTYQEMLNMGQEILEKEAIAEARTDAWLLLAMACRIDRNFYYLHMEEDVTEEQYSGYRIALRERAKHVPLQYIVGETEFMGLRFKVNSSVLIPRQDTETLVEEAVKILQPGMRVLDLCTGSGCIIISILHYVPGISAFATDISKQAVNVAKENAKLNHSQILFETGDLFDNVTGKFDMIVSNPPYIRSSDIPNLMPEVSVFEPIEALDGKEDGLYFYRRIIAESPSYLNPGGTIFFEIGCDQGREVSGMLKKAGFMDVKVIQDLAHHDRVVSGKWNINI